MNPVQDRRLDLSMPDRSGTDVAYLADDRQLVSDVSTRRLRSTNTAMCDVRRYKTLSVTGVLRPLVPACGTSCQHTYDNTTVLDSLNERSLKTHLFGAL